MDKNQDRIDRLFDGDLPEDERRELERQMETDRGLRAELSSLNDAVRLLEGAKPLETPADFTRQVMQRLPEQRASLIDRVRTFLFRGRVLRWNMATAAVAALLLVTAGLAIRHYRPASVTTAQQQTVTVRLNFYAPAAQRVAVAGDFNRWQTNANPLVRADGGVWTVDIRLQPGSYSYMFVVNGTTWVPDPAAESFQDDGFGKKSAVMRVQT
ncbi:MAG: hypothetical protein M0042_14415 [Nitrospiraceae bacterium]|nr:hypothetical protein [Nitrospiraceae bacterium]